MVARVAHFDVLNVHSNPHSANLRIVPKEQHDTHANGIGFRSVDRNGLCKQPQVVFVCLAHAISCSGRVLERNLRSTSLMGVSGAYRYLRMFIQ